MTAEHCGAVFFQIDHKIEVVFQRLMRALPKFAISHAIVTEDPTLAL